MILLRENIEDLRVSGVRDFIDSQTNNAFQVIEHLKHVVVFKGPSAPAVDYAAIRRQQEQERARLQAIRDEEFRVSGVKDYIDFQFDNPFQVTEKAETGRFFNAISPGRLPGDALSDYMNDKSITAKALKENTDKFFKNRVSIPSVKEGRIQFGKRADKPSSAGLLGSSDDENKKALLGA